MLFHCLKRFMLAALAIAMAVSFSACGGNESQAPVSSAPEETSGSEQAQELPTGEYVKGNLPGFTYVEDYFKEVPYVGLYEADSLKAYYTESADQPIYPASLTKLVTSLTALKYCPPDMLCRAGDELNLVQPHSSMMWLQTGMKLTLEQLIYGMMLPSGNDAAYTAAVNVARSIKGNENLSAAEAVEYFCGLMNDYCKEIGAVNSHFVNPEGWDDQRQYTTVADLAIIASCVMENEVISKIAATPEIKFVIESGETFLLSNSNLLIHAENELYNSVFTGLKTGTTDFAGACLVATAKIDTEDYILIVAGCKDNISRFNFVSGLLEFAYRYHYANRFYQNLEMLPQ